MVRLASHGWLVKFTVFDESVFLALDYGLPDWGGGECACDAGNIVFHALPLNLLERQTSLWSD